MSGNREREADEVAGLIMANVLSASLSSGNDWDAARKKIADKLLAWFENGQEDIRSQAGARNCEGGWMKITKEMLLDLRGASVECRRLKADVKVDPLALLALIDERSAMLAAAKDLATAFRARANMWPDKPEAFVYFAVARDIEEHPAFTQNRGDG